MSAAHTLVLLGFVGSLALTLTIVWRGTRRIPASARMLLAWRGGRARFPKPVVVAIWTIAPIASAIFGIAVGTGLFRGPGAGLGILILAGVIPAATAASIKAAVDDFDRQPSRHH